MTAPAKQLSDGNPGGSGLGQSATDLISFHGVTPTAQAATVAQLVATVAASTAAMGFTTSTQFNDALSAINSILTCLKNKGLLSAS